MKKQKIPIIILGVVIVVVLVLTAFRNRPEPQYLLQEQANDPLKKMAFAILNTQCNGCHRRQNPFMVFKEKNLEKRAAKIYQAVFVDRRMPKGDEINLSNEEYATLKSWLLTQQN